MRFGSFAANRQRTARHHDAGQAVSPKLHSAILVSSRLISVALVLSLLLFTQPDIFAQQIGAQSQQYASSPYIQPTPNYVANSQYKPTPYEYPQQPNTAPSQRDYAQPNQYGNQQGYSQQQEQEPYPQTPSNQQPYANPGQGYAGQGYSGQTDPGQSLSYAPDEQNFSGGQESGVPYPNGAQPSYGPQQQAAQPFAADQLEQLVAPIALYPDGLVAQILAASTYPAQVASADNWVRSQGNASPDQIANGSSAQTDWDPSVKALTAFPQVLDLMNHDLRWTTDLGNAYFNQPQDVLQSIQVLRQRAQAAGNLQNTPQEQVSDNQGYVQIAPANPQVVYVPMYNPWSAYGQPISPYPGFSLVGVLASFADSGIVRFGLGIAMGAFMHTPFGWAGWALNWLASSIFFNHSPYYSRSTSVAHFGGYGRGYGRGRYGSQMGGINRTPRGFSRPEQGRSQQGFERFGSRGTEQGFNRPGLRTQESYGANRGFENQNRAYAGEYARPGMQNYAYNRPQAMQQRQQAYARPNAYGQGFNQGAPRGYAGSQPYARGGAYSYQRNDLSQRAYAEPRSAFGGRGGAESFRSNERSGGSHLFGGGHGGESFHTSYHAPKAPKAPKMSGGGHFGGGHFHGGGHSGGGHSSHHGR
jgi:hypothetical protein